MGYFTDYDYGLGEKATEWKRVSGPLEKILSLGWIGYVMQVFE